MKKLKILGNVLVVVSLFIIAKTLYQSPLDWKHFLATTNKPLLFIVFLCYMGILLFQAFLFNFLLSMVSCQKLKKLPILCNYTKSNLYKYLPGNVFQYVARNQLALTQKIPVADITLTSVLEIASLALSATLVTLIFSANFAFEWFLKNKISSIVPLAGVCLLVVFMVFCFIFKNKLRSFFAKYADLLKKKTLLILGQTQLFYCLFHLLNGFCYLLLLYAIGFEITISLFTTFIGLFAFSWLLGFVTPGSPGGIGIREAVMGFFFSSFITTDIILFSAIVYRLIGVCAEISSYLFLLIFRKLTKK